MKIARNLLGFLLFGLCTGLVFGQATVTGVVVPYANGQVSATVGTVQSNGPIDGQGNFAVQVPSNSSPLMTFTPPAGSPYGIISLTITAGQGTTNITQQVNNLITPVGINLGITNQTAVGTNAQGFAVPGQGGTSGSNPGTCTVNTTLNKCLGVSPYLAVAGDWSAAINQAMSDLSTTGGTVHGCGVYQVNGPLLNPSGANAVLQVPTIQSVAGSTNITIEILGCQYTTPNINALSGMTLQTSVSTAGGNLIGGFDAASTTFGTFTAVRLVLKHVNVISTQEVPTLNLVNASWINAFSSEDVVIAGTGCSAAPATNAGGIGLQTPNLSNNFEVTIDQTVISCMPVAAILREHTHVGTLWLGPNHDCVTLDGGGIGSNSIQADQIWGQGCVNYLIGGAHSVGVNISEFDMESDPGTGLNIADPNNFISGLLFYKKQSPAGAATISGGSNLLACNLNVISSCFGGTPISQFLENWKSEEGSGTTLANTGSDSTNTATTTNITWSTAVTGFGGVAVPVYNGTSSFAVAASATQTNFDGTTPFSACMWFNATVNGSTNALISTLSTATGNPGWRADMTSGLPEVYLANNIGAGNYIQVQATNATTAGVIHLFCFTYTGSKDASGVILYVDGAVATTTAVHNALTGSIVSGVPVSIGTDGAVQDIWFNGALGRVRIFNSVISAATISAMFSAGPNAQ